MSSYYIYAIKPQHGDMVKIGYYIADLNDLYKRYITPYGPGMDVCVFEVQNKEVAKSHEKRIHDVLKHAGQHLEGELFKVGCMALFLDTAASICNKVVAVAETRSSHARKLQAEARRIERQQKHDLCKEETRLKRQHHLRGLKQAVLEVLKSRQFIKAAALRQDMSNKLHRNVGQKDLQAVMDSVGYEYRNKKMNGQTQRLYVKTSW